VIEQEFGGDPIIFRYQSDVMAIIVFSDKSPLMAIPALSDVMRISRDPGQSMSGEMAYPDRYQVMPNQ
jgi:hypothetical protein